MVNSGSESVEEDLSERGRRTTGTSPLLALTRASSSMIRA